MNHFIAFMGSVVGLLVHRCPRHHFEEDCRSGDTKKLPNETDESGSSEASAGRKMDFGWSLMQHTLEDGMCEGWRFFCRLSGIIVKLLTNVCGYLFLGNLDGLRVYWCRGGDDLVPGDGSRSEGLPDPYDDQLLVELYCSLIKYDLPGMWQRRCLYCRLPLARNNLLAGLCLCNRCRMGCSDAHVSLHEELLRRFRYVTAALPADPRDKSGVEEFRYGDDFLQEDRSRFEVLPGATHKSVKRKGSEKLLMDLVNADLQKQILDLKDRLHHAEADLYASRQQCERLQAACKMLKVVAKEFICAVDELE